MWFFSSLQLGSGAEEEGVEGKQLPFCRCSWPSSRLESSTLSTFQPHKFSLCPWQIGTISIFFAQEESESGRVTQPHSTMATQQTWETEQDFYILSQDSIFGNLVNCYSLLSIIITRKLVFEAPQSKISPTNTILSPQLMWSSNILGILLILVSLGDIFLFWELVVEHRQDHH